jgi:hypothetical protein
MVADAVAVERVSCGAHFPGNREKYREKVYKNDFSSLPTTRKARKVWAFFDFF